MTSFKIAFHDISGRRMVEVFEGGELIASIYPDEGGRSIKIVSKHQMSAQPEDTSENALIVRIG